jgi:hypothetical protein
MQSTVVRKEESVEEESVEEQTTTKITDNNKQ